MKDNKKHNSAVRNLVTEIRVVLDTNLFIASHWNKSAASTKIIKLCINRRATAYYTEDMSRELDRILNNIHAKQEFIDTVNKFRETGVKLDGVPPAEQRTPDPDDQKFVNCAVAADADYLISSDDHLLSLQHLDRTLIVKPSTFWREVGCKLQSSLEE